MRQILLTNPIRIDFEVKQNLVEVIELFLEVAGSLGIDLNNNNWEDKINS